jgi:pimeloyl-ACP methyl ester carboxylesterase
MKNLRTYGQPPLTIAVIHGGPGAAGEMAPVARELAPHGGILEPLQTATSLTGQVEELKMVLETHGDLPVTLIGYSWGAWLSFIMAAHYPTLVKKLILVSSGPFEEKYVAQLQENRFNRLTAAEKTEFETVLQALTEPATADKDALLARLGALAAKTDMYDPLAADKSDLVGLQGDLYQSVWQEAAEMRRNGQLLALSQHLTCPVVALHGDYDPHPAEGVQLPLSTMLKNFRFVLLKNCGHTPWLERQAKGNFYRILKKELP